MKEYKFCQSCGYPMKKDPQGGGTEKDGSINKKYCYMCYKDGEFLTPSEVDTADKMQTFCIEQMKKDGMNGFVAWLATRGIPKLERWKS
ncbi:MAG: zinc ribbon domain-containing protein [Clostridiales bacterium]|nr:zinc ribbon domain-containing protein [Clostridiales bacterium]